MGRFVHSKIICSIKNYKRIYLCKEKVYIYSLINDEQKNYIRYPNYKTKYSNFKLIYIIKKSSGKSRV
jgi:hypothetical protein